MGLMLAAIALSAQAFDMQGALNGIRQKNSVPALGCAVLSLDGRLDRWVSGVRQAGQAEAVTVNDTWCIGSNVKAMTGVLVANEVEQNALQWNEKLSKALGASKIDPSYASVTVENLATMTGGMDAAPPKGWGGYTGTDPVELRKQAATDQLGAKSVKAMPGQFFRSDWSYVLLGHIVEKIESLPLEDVMQRAIWYPIPLDAAAWGPNDDHEPVGHDASGMAHPGADQPALMDGADRARMSLRNWLVFLANVLHSFRDHSRFVPDAYAKEIAAAPAESFCLGWNKTTRPWAKNPVLWQEADDTLTHSVAWMDPIGGVVYIAVCNEGGPGAKAACDQAIQAMIDNNVR